MTVGGHAEVVTGESLVHDTKSSAQLDWTNRSVNQVTLGHTTGIERKTTE